MFPMTVDEATTQVETWLGASAGSVTGFPADPVMRRRTGGVPVPVST